MGLSVSLPHTGQGTDNITTCQYKVIFDKHKFARSFHWRAVDPAEAACPPAAAEARRYTLSADALFAFDKGDAASMNAKGRAELDDLAGKLKSFDRLQSIRVTGYTDYLGSDSYNLALSQQRADTVRQYLIAQGIAAGLIQAHGAGKQQPVKECAHTGSREALIACLQPEPPCGNRSQRLGTCPALMQAVSKAFREMRKAFLQQLAALLLLLRRQEPSLKHSFSYTNPKK